jgi:SNF2 family DNA or RNA helicase
MDNNNAPVNSNSPPPPNNNNNNNNNNNVTSASSSSSSSNPLIQNINLSLIPKNLVELLQVQIKAFKSFSKRYTDNPLIHKPGSKEFGEVSRSNNHRSSSSTITSGSHSSNNIALPRPPVIYNNQQQSNHNSNPDSSHNKGYIQVKQEPKPLSKYARQKLAKLAEAKAKEEAQQQGNNNNLSTNSIDLSNSSIIKKSTSNTDMNGDCIKLEKNSTTNNLNSNSKIVSNVLPPENYEPMKTGLSWQTTNSLMMVGPNKNPDAGMISIAPSDIGCFSKTGHLPLLLTYPFTTTFRENCLLHEYNKSQKQLDSNSSNSNNEVSMTNDNDSKNSRENKELIIKNENKLNKLWKLQRIARSMLISNYINKVDKPNKSSSISNPNNSSLNKIHPTPQSGIGGITSSMFPRKSLLRIKKQSKKETRAWDREEKKRQTAIETIQKKKTNDYFKLLMLHRDDFLKHHRTKKSDILRNAKGVRSYLDYVDVRKEKDKSKDEARRLQALKENDMDAYNKLVAETKNDRLHYLIEQTDGYIATINRMVQDQRNVDNGDEDSTSVPVGDDKVNKMINDMPTVENKKGTKISQDYYSQTHSRMEKVVQPSMLRGGDLKEYQLSGLQWMVSLYNNNLNGILADEMGLGKTIQTIALLAYIMEFKKNMGPFLIVVPLSTLSNWVNECTKWAPDMIKVVYKGTPPVRKQIFKEEVEPGRFNVMLTTYEYIMFDKYALKKIYWQYIIVDEGHRMKNANSKFAQTLGTEYQSKNRILLTGTPLQNNLPELWALLNFLLPSIFSSVDTFDQWFNKPFAAFRNQPAVVKGAPAETENSLNQEEQLLIVNRLHEVLRPFMLRRVKDQVLDQLPEKTETVLRCDLSGWQRNLYKSIHNKNTLDEEKGSGGVNNAMMQLRKVCNHPYLFLNDWYVDEDIVRSSGKFELLDRMLPKLKGAGHRVLMFSQMTTLMTILERYFDYKSLKYLRLDGSTSSEEREKRMFMFNDPDSPYFIFLLSTRAGGLGLNLATADTVIIFDSDWNPMMDAQAQDRAHRIGQKNEVKVFRLITTSPVEERILARATDKRNLNGLVVEAGKFNSDGNIKNLKEQDSKEMMEEMLKEWTEGGSAAASGTGEDAEDGEIVGEPEVEIPDDNSINLLMAHDQNEVALFTQMDIAYHLKRKTNWVNMNVSKGIVDQSIHEKVPSQLMGLHETPTWLNADSWNTKHVHLINKMNDDKKKKNGSTMNMNILDSSNILREHDDEDGSQMIVAGKLMRKRKKEVVYDDFKTEKEFLDMVEENAEVEENEAKASKLAWKLNRKTPGSEPVFKPAPILMEEEYSKNLNKILVEIQKIRRSDGSGYADLFREKPSMTLFPDYYAIISNPISFKEIGNTLRKRLYATTYQLELDLALLSHNARIYNGSVSAVFTSIEFLRSEFYKRCSNMNLISSNVMPTLPHDSHLIMSTLTPDKIAPQVQVSNNLVQLNETSGLPPQKKKRSNSINEDGSLKKVNSSPGPGGRGRGRGDGTGRASGRSGRGRGRNNNLNKPNNNPNNQGITSLQANNQDFTKQIKRPRMHQFSESEGSDDDDDEEEVNNVAKPPIKLKLSLSLKPPLNQPPNSGNLPPRPQHQQQQHPRAQQQRPGGNMHHNPPQQHPSPPLQQQQRQTNQPPVVGMPPAVSSHVNAAHSFANMAPRRKSNPPPRHVVNSNNSSNNFGSNNIGISNNSSSNSETKQNTPKLSFKFNLKKPE